MYGRTPWLSSATHPSSRHHGDVLVANQRVDATHQVTDHIGGMLRCAGQDAPLTRLGAGSLCSVGTDLLGQRDFQLVIGAERVEHPRLACGDGALTDVFGDRFDRWCWQRDGDVAIVRVIGYVGMLLCMRGGIMEARRRRTPLVFVNYYTQNTGKRCYKDLYTWKGMP